MNIRKDKQHTSNKFTGMMSEMCEDRGIVKNSTSIL